MTRNFDDEKREPQPIIIEDLRHSRDNQADEEPEEAARPAMPRDEPVKATAPAAPQAPAMEVMEPPRGEANPVGAGQEFEPPQPAADQSQSQSYDHAHEPGSAAEQAEYMQLLQIFELGLDNYQKNQLGIYIQFAIIHLGRAPHPVTNLIATDLHMARFAIDLLHVCYTHLEPQLATEERQEFKSVLSNLQLTFAQLAGNVPVPPETQG